MSQKLDKYRGCLLGGAIGDALGYAVEFMRYGSILEKYGENGITEYDLTFGGGKAIISDDTQMTLFTSTGLLVGETRGKMRGIMGRYEDYCYLSYLDWLTTQDRNIKDKSGYSWLSNIHELYSSRAPGSTCLSALRSGVQGRTDAPINTSKGCGGVMRVAPVGLFLKPDIYPQKEIDRVGAEVAAITHGHDLGYLPAAMLVHIISKLVHGDMDLRTAVEDALVAIAELYPNAEHISDLSAIIEKAMRLSEEKIPDIDAIRSLGEGWVAEETLAVAIYCALKHENDFASAVTAAVNHDGDSDSTGAVCGNIMGAYLGADAIPRKFLENLELRSVIEEIADDLYSGFPMSEYGDAYDGKWTQKYIEMTY